MPQPVAGAVVGDYGIKAGDNNCHSKNKASGGSAIIVIGKVTIIVII